MPLNLPLVHPKHDQELIVKSVEEILSTTPLLSMATVSPGGRSHINAAYFAFDEALNLFIVTDPKTMHAQHLETNPSVAVTVFDSHQTFWTKLRGIQLSGTCAKTSALQLPHALSCFLQRFPALKTLVKDPEDFSKETTKLRLYSIVPERIKVLDEPRFGEEEFIEFNLTRIADPLR